MSRSLRKRGAEPGLNCNDDTELVLGSGNLFRDFGDPDSELEQLRAILAAQTIKTLDARGLFSRIRRVKLDHLTIDRLLTILDRLSQRVKISISVRAGERSRPASAGL